MPYTVLVPTDGSDHALRAAEHGATLADALDATLHVISVVDLRLEAGPFSAGGLQDDVKERLREDAHRRIDRTLEVVDDPDDARTTVRKGVPIEEIVEYAEANEIAMLAMGTAGRTGLSRFLMGSTTERVIRHAEMPVLAVNARDLDVD